MQTAQAASFTAAQVLPAIFASPNSKVQLTVSEVKPLGTGDPTGLGLMFLCLCTVLAGLPAGIALAFLSKTRRPSSLADAAVRALVLLAFSAFAGLCIALLADVVLGYGGSRVLSVWGWSSLLCAAAGVTATALIGLVGLPGILLTAIPIFFFGVASAPAPSPWNFQSGIFRTLGPFDAFGATTNGIRNAVFFPDASQAQNVEVLVVWIVSALLLLLGLGWWSGRRERSVTKVADPALAPS